jgi:DNA-binding CsgD family transcriptional regulator
MDADFEQALAHTRNPVLVVDDERRYVDCNDAALSLLGMSREQLLTYRIDDLYVLDGDGDGGLDHVWRDFLERGGDTGLARLRVPDGRHLQLRYGAVAHVAPGRHLSIFLVEDGDGHLPPDPERVLTAREAEVLGLAAHGLTTRQIAERLVVSPTTIDSHIRSAMERLGARNRVHAVALALGRGEVVLEADD